MQSPKYSLLPASEEDVLEENCEHDDISLEGLLARPGARVPEPYSTIVRRRCPNPISMALEGLQTGVPAFSNTANILYTG